MKIFSTWVSVLVLVWPALGYAQCQLLPDTQLRAVFGGEARQIAARFRNAGSESVSAEMRLRLYQTSSATVALVTENAWKRIELLSGQTVLETALVNFPAVRAETAFLIQWVADSNHILGSTRVLVYPTNLLGEMKPLLKDGDLGMLDPDGAFKPVLTQNGVAFLDLGGKALEEFSGKLAIIGPFQSRSQMHDGLAQAVRKMAQRGVAVVWIQPPPEPTDPMVPSFYVVPGGKASVVVVKSDLVIDFSKTPKSQLNLVYFCRLALNPAPLSLPYLGLQP